MALTDAEKTTITNAANKASHFVSGKNLTPDAQNKILQTVDSIKGTGKPNIGDEAIALWVAKINYAIANGDKPTVSKLITAPAQTAEPMLRTAGGGASVLRTRAAEQFYDSNGGCSCNGGGTGPASW